MQILLIGTFLSTLGVVCVAVSQIGSGYGQRTLGLGLRILANAGWICLFAGFLSQLLFYWIFPGMAGRFTMPLR